MNVNRRGFFALLAATLVPSTSNRWGGIRAFWIDEGGPLPPDIRLTDIRLKKLQTPVKASNRLVTDRKMRVKFDWHRHAFSFKWEKV